MIKSAISGYAERLTKLHKLGMSQAWHAGVIAKTSKTPPLSQLLGSDDKRPPQSTMASRERMQAHFSTLAHKGLVAVRQIN